MSRRCEFSGKGWQSGNQVSHANNKTKTRFMPNLCDVTLMSDALGNSYSFRISAHALKSVEHRGGLDAFLLKAGNSELSAKALKLKRAIAYAKSVVFLDTLRRELGDDIFWHAIQRYTRDNFNKTVTAANLQRAFERESKRKLDQIFRTWVFGEP